MKASYDFTLYGFHRVSIEGYSNLSLLRQSNYCVGWRSDIVVGPSTEIVLAGKKNFFPLGEYEVKSEYAVLASLMQLGTLYQTAKKLGVNDYIGSKTGIVATHMVTNAIHNSSTGVKTMYDGVKSVFSGSKNSVVGTENKITESSTEIGIIKETVVDVKSFV
jgi:hypothetical protein